MVTTPFTLGRAVREGARAHGSRPALTFEGTTLTHADLDERSSRVARALLAEGLRPQARVAFLDKNCPEFYDVVLGGSKANLVTVPVNWRLTPPEIAHAVEDSGAEILIVGHDFVDLVAAIRDELPAIRKVVVIGGGRDTECFGEWAMAHPPEDPMVPSSADDLYLQLYTSGTTGFPKGAMLTNAASATFLPLAEELELGPDTVLLMMLPLFHTSSSVPFSLVCAGGHCVLHREVDLVKAFTAIGEWRVTHAGFVPAMLQVMTAMPQAAETDLSSLDVIFYGGSPISESVLEASMMAFDCRFVQLFGLTETCGTITMLRPADHDPHDRPHLLRSIGRPLPWIELRVVDPDTGEACRPGEVGELWTRSAQNMRGYLGRADATAEAITPDGWLRTGDLGYADEEGYLYLSDRLKDMIVSGSENVYPAEVENVLMGHPAVADVAVIGVPHERWGETVKAIVLIGPGHEVTEGELVAHARARLAHYKCPTSVDFTTDPLPRNPIGKLLKRVIKAPYWRDADRSVH